MTLSSYVQFEVLSVQIVVLELWLLVARFNFTKVAEQNHRIKFQIDHSTSLFAVVVNNYIITSKNATEIQVDSIFKSIIVE